MLLLFDDDKKCTLVATGIEFLSRMAKIVSGPLFEMVGLDGIKICFYGANALKNLLFIYTGYKFWPFLIIYTI